MISFWKVPRLDPFVLLVRETMSMGYMWKNTNRGKLKYWNKTYPVSLFLAKLSRGLAHNQARASSTMFIYSARTVQ